MTNVTYAIDNSLDNNDSARFFSSVEPRDHKVVEIKVFRDIVLIQNFLVALFQIVSWRFKT